MMIMRKPATTSRFRAGRRRPDGFIMVAVLSISLMLATLATIYSIYVSKSALALTATDAGIETELAVSGALELAAYQLLVPEKDDRPTHGEFRVRIGHANLAVTFVSEAARIDLNEAPKPLLAACSRCCRGTQIGSESLRRSGHRLAHRGESWRGDQEASLYRAAGLSYSPRGAPFAHVSELWLVQGLPPALVERALPFVTVYSGQPAVDILDAAPEVLAALPDMTEDRLDNILNRRETATIAPKSAADILGTDERAATTKGGNAFRVDVRIKFDDGRSAASEAVILLGSEKVPYQVLSWRDGADERQPQARRTGAR